MYGKVSGGWGQGFWPPEPPLPSGCSRSLLVFLSPGQVPAGWGLLPEVLVMSCQHGFPSPSPDFKPTLGFPVLWALLSPKCLPGPGPQLHASSSLMNWTPWPQAGGEVETLEV